MYFLFGIDLYVLQGYLLHHGNWKDNIKEAQEGMKVLVDDEFCSAADVRCEKVLEGHISYHGNEVWCSNTLP